MIRLLGPQLEKCINTREDHQLLLALLDLDVRNDDELQSLCDEWQLVLKRKDAILEAHPDDAIVLDRLLALVTDCYIDRFKLKGINAKDKVPKFLKLLNAYDYQGLETFLADDSVDEHAAMGMPRKVSLFGRTDHDETFALDDDFM